MANFLINGLLTAFIFYFGRIFDQQMFLTDPYLTTLSLLLLSLAMAKTEKKEKESVLVMRGKESWKTVCNTGKKTVMSQSTFLCWKQLDIKCFVNCPGWYVKNSFCKVQPRWLLVFFITKFIAYLFLGLLCPWFSSHFRGADPSCSLAVPAVLFIIKIKCSFATFALPITYLVCPPKFCISLNFNICLGTTVTPRRYWEKMDTHKKVQTKYTEHRTRNMKIDQTKWEHVFDWRSHDSFFVRWGEVLSGPPYLFLTTTGCLSAPRPPPPPNGLSHLKNCVLILLGNGLLNPFNGQHTFKFVSWVIVVFQQFL